MKDKQYKVFLVDDDTKHLIMLKNHLEKKSEYDIKVNIFSNGENCLDKMHENPHIVILDYYLDGIKTDAANGLEILKKIRATNPDTYVIMMSGQDDLKVAIATIDNGAYDYIIKGESAYVRAQMIIDHIIENINNLEWKRNMKIRETALVTGFILLGCVLVALALYDMGMFD
ncbi:MAG TPA: response regulator [Chitinophagales bacterium]|nr:response regulator [Chitinophagales bacterium]HRG28612.1 response regulator [Chitinophagales bacterium]HRG86572.1 response regulator [Chitinophagales bacterium]HRH54968.1 response regulator [Chitinophagales bacterium]